MRYGREDIFIFIFYTLIYEINPSISSLEALGQAVG